MPKNAQSVGYAIMANVARLLQGDLCRLRPYAIEELPADNVLPVDEDDQYQDTDSVERFFRFDVRHQVTGSQSEVGAYQAADQRYVRGANLLLADVTLGGTVRRIKELKSKMEMVNAELETICRVVTYEVEFSTTRSDPSAPGY